MIARWILLALLPVVAIIALSQSRRLSAIIGMGLFSLLLAAAPAALASPGDPRDIRNGLVIPDEG